MKITPDQIRAARALLRLEAYEVAERAHVSLAALAAAEGADEADTMTVDVVRSALEQAGAEFIPDGVRKRRPVRPDAQERFEMLEAISKRSGARLSGQSLLTDDDLYDEHGLPS